MIYLKLDIVLKDERILMYDSYQVIGKFLASNYRIIVSKDKKETFELSELDKIEITLKGYEWEPARSGQSRGESGISNYIKIVSPKIEDPIKVRVKIGDISEYKRVQMLAKYWKSKNINVLLRR